MTSEQSLKTRVAGVLQWVGAACAVLAIATPAVAAPPPTLAELQARAQIQDLLVDYYAHLGGDESHFGDFYVDDGVLDVNGDVAQGQKAIGELYRQLRASASNPPRKGTFRMLLTNARITVKGDSATADVLWTGVLNTDLSAPPQFAEQGREHDELVRRNDRWLFKYREITADSGMPKMFDKTYKKR